MFELVIFLNGYFIATLWEHYLHNNILHAPQLKIKKWRKSQFRFFTMLYHAYYSHHVVHHQLSFKTKYTQQFDNVEEQKKLDDLLIKKFSKTENQQNYGLTINSFYEYGMFLLPTFFMLPMLAFFLEYYELIIFAVPLTFPLLLSKYIHPILHTDMKNKHWIYNNVYIRKIYRIHYIHHHDDSKNFNLLLGGDCLMGTYKK